MKPDKQFINQPKFFWSYVRVISQKAGYKDRQQDQIKVPSLEEIVNVLKSVGLKSSLISNEQNHLTDLGKVLLAYFKYRATILDKYVEPNLMDVNQAKDIFNDLLNRLSPRCPIPMNKQKKEKKTPAYLTGIVNMLIEANSEGLPCDYDPHQLVIVTADNAPIRTLTRRFDGAFTSTIDPIAIWEVKEYYYTTTFGSRVADGIYESLLDGLELEELRENEGIDIKHYLIVDAHDTWWVQGRSYLCRIIDMLHMGYVDEVLFGHEVLERLPEIVKEWVSIIRKRP